MKKENNISETLVGVSMIGCTAAGVMGIIFALISVFSLDWIGAGICLTASGVSFGLLANAVLRT